MLFGIREACDIVFRTKTNQKIGNRIFYAGEPVIYFDSLKTTSLEGAATTVYAQGGRGNARLIAWEGERTMTLTFEDALISPLGFSILSGAGLIEATDDENGKIQVHTTQQVYCKVAGELDVDEAPSTADGAVIYIMPLDENGEITSEPIIGSATGKKITIATGGDYDATKNNPDELKTLNKGTTYLIDFYVDKGKGATQIEITADKFGGNFYIEASTLFRNKAGVDMPAELIIPNAKVQSNFTFTMAGSGDPSTFTFTLDAFPDYTRFNKEKKVLAAIQIIAEAQGSSTAKRNETNSKDTVDANGMIIENSAQG